MNVKRLLLVLAFGLFTASWGYAQTGNIAGTVTDAETGEVLPGVNVVIEGTERGTSTNADGDYRIANVEPGTYTLRASFVGYAETVVEDVDVQIELTTEVDIAMQEQTAQLQEVVVRSEAPVIQRDISGTQRNVSAEEIEAGRYHNINNVISAQVGINSTRLHDDRPEMRGSDFSQQKFIVDGIEQDDPLTGRPHNRVNLDAVQEVKVQTGGFSARYGDARSGVVNVVLKEGREWTGSANVRYSPPGLKHFGPMIYGFDSPIVEPFVKEEHGAFTGNDFFEGWNAVANERLNEGDPHYGNPDELYARWLWRHRSRDALNELQRLDEEGRVDIEWAEGINPDEMDFHQYGVRPDYDLNFTLGGPIPATPLSFFGSYSGTQKEYARTFPKPTYEDKQVRGKLTMNVMEGMKLRASGFWGREAGGDGGQGPGVTGFISSDPFRALGSTNKNWYPHCAVPGQQTRQNYGLQLTHAFSENTYYEARFSHHRTDYEMLQEMRNTAPIPGTDGVTTSGKDAGVFEGRIGTEEYANAMAEQGAEGWENWRDWARVKIGDHWYDESPKGYGPVNWRDVTGYYRMESCNLRANETFSRKNVVEALASTQINQHNQISAGFDASRGRINQFYQAIDPSVNAGSLTKSDNNYWMGALWAEDKLEYEGFIANLGLRLDFLRHGDFPMIDPNAEPGAPNSPYTPLLQPGNTIPEGEEDPRIEALIPNQSVSHAMLSPRLGISHPISTLAKVFFNYGHFYEWPSLFQAYRVEYDSRGGNRVDDIGNPNLRPPRTIQYELGYEHNLFNAASLSLTGYYKNVTDEIDDIGFHPLEGRSFEMQSNIGFADIRGLEALLELRRETVPYVSGWLSANYWVRSGAEFGLEDFYEDPSRQPGLADYEVSNPDVQPIIKGHINFHTPSGFGPDVAGIRPLARWNLAFSYTWQRGEAFTWNPGDIPLVEDNVRWAPYQRWDMRLQKDLAEVGGVTSQFYLDVGNIFNTRNLTMPWGGSYRGYWAWDGHRWWNNQFQNYMYSLGFTDENQSEDGSFNTDRTPGDWQGADVELPAFSPWRFLEPRQVHFGFKVKF